MSEITVTIKCSNASTASVSIETSASVLDLKNKIADILSVPAIQQRLIYKGRVLKDDLTLEHYEVQDGHVVHMVKGSAPAGSAPVSTTSQPSTSTPLAAPSSGPAPAAAPLPNPFLAGNPMAMPGMPDLGGDGGFNRMQEQMLRNPDMMQSIMSSPMMDNLLNNPDMMRNMMLNNPQMQSLLDANPHIRHILNDPAVLRQSMEMMRNPNAMREAMRSQDLAMSQLENLPGGFNALRRMFEDVHEPMMEASQNMNASTTTPTNTTNTSSSSSAPTNSAVPNPWDASNASRANPFNAAGGLGGLGGFGAGGLGGGFGGMPGMPGMPPMDPNQMNAMMSNPFYQQMMQQMLSDPAMLDQMSAMNPQLGMALQNPQIRAMMTNPDVLRQLSNPQTMQAMQQMQQSMQYLNSQGLMPGFGAPGAFGAPPSGGLNFDALFGGAAPPMGAMGANPFSQPIAAPVAQNPAERFASQLRQLADMGFTDENANLRALQRTNGNVNAAVEILLGGN